MTTSQAPPYRPPVKTQEARNRFALALCKVNLHRAPGPQAYWMIELVTCTPMPMRLGDP